MTIRASKFASNQVATVAADCAGDVIVNDYFYDLPAAQNITGDIIDMGILPAYHTVSDVVMVCDDLDTGGAPAITLDVGLMSGTPGDTASVRTCGAEIFAADATAKNGGIARPTLASAFKIQATETDRSIGVKIVAQSATPAAGRIRLRVFMHAADHKLAF